VTARGPTLPERPEDPDNANRMPQRRRQSRRQLSLLQPDAGVQDRWLSNRSAYTSVGRVGTDRADRV
jgi:hypothetical protein